jgi:3-oxoacyl-ACP reductase-like protein
MINSDRLKVSAVQVRCLLGAETRGAAPGLPLVFERAAAARWARQLAALNDAPCAPTAAHGDSIRQPSGASAMLTVVLDATNALLGRRA